MRLNSTRPTVAGKTAAFVVLGLLGLCSFGGPLCSSTRAAPQQAARSNSPASTTHDELLARINELSKAKAAEDPAKTEQASKRVIAVALRQLARLRLLESAIPQAIKLYEKSLELEDSAEAHTDLAVAYVRFNQPDDAIRQANEAIALAPKSARAYSTLGSALMFKKQYAQATTALTKSIELGPDIEAQYYLGVAYLSTGDPKDKERAAKVFVGMSQSLGDSGSLHVMFGRAYRDAGDMQAAIREFEHAIRIDTRTPHAHYFLGLAKLAVNEWNSTPEVTAEFHKELSYYPEDYLANYMLGFDAFNLRKYDECDKYLKKAAQVSPKTPDAWLYLGLNAYAREQMGPAEEYLRKAIELTGVDESRSNYQIRRAYIDLGRILNSSGRKEEATPYLDKAREFQKKILETSQQGMASHFAEEGASGVAGAVPLIAENEQARPPSKNEDINPFMQVDPAVLANSSLTPLQKEKAAKEEEQLRAALGVAYTDLGTTEAIRKEYRVALEHYQEAEKWDPASAGLARNIGIAAFRVQDYSEAARGLAAALATNPEDGAARAMLGMTYFAQDKYKEAGTTFEPLGQKGMKDATVGYAWASSLAKLGELQQASSVLQEFSSEERPISVWMLVGQLWIEIADYSRAESTFERVLQLDPSTPKAHYCAGQAYVRSEHWNEAAREFQAELTLHPSDVDARFNLGFVCLQQSKQAEAERLFQEVIAAEPEHASAQYEYGKILMDHGDVAGAIAHLEIAARLRPNTDYVHYQLQSAYRKEGRITDADRELEIYKQIKAKKRGRASEAILDKQTP